MNDVCMFTRQQHAEPDQVDAQGLSATFTEQRNDDEGQLEEVEEEGQDEDQDIHDDQEADRSAGQPQEEVLDPLIAVDAVEAKAEDARAHQDEDDEGRELCGHVHRLAQQGEVQASIGERQEHRAGGSHRSAFGRSREADEDRAQHQEDQRQGRHHARMTTCWASRLSSPRLKARLATRQNVGDQAAIDAAQMTLPVQRPYASTRLPATTQTTSTNRDRSSDRSRRLPAP
jgi:hypothetical protein